MISQNPTPGTGMPNYLGMKVFTSGWLDRNQPSKPIDFGLYGYLVSQDLYDELTTLAERNPVVNFPKEVKNADT
jgi:hypothetical protein